jgi:ribonuclease E
MAQEEAAADTPAPAAQETAAEPAAADLLAAPAANDAGPEARDAQDTGSPRRGWWQRTFGA